MGYSDSYLTRKAKEIISESYNIITTDSQIILLGAALQVSSNKINYHNNHLLNKVEFSLGSIDQAWENKEFWINYAIELASRKKPKTR